MRHGGMGGAPNAGAAPCANGCARRGAQDESWRWQARPISNRRDFSRLFAACERTILSGCKGEREQGIIARPVATCLVGGRFKIRFVVGKVYYWHLRSWGPVVTLLLQLLPCVGSPRAIWGCTTNARHPPRPRVPPLWLWLVQLELLGGLQRAHCTTSPQTEFQLHASATTAPRTRCSNWATSSQPRLSPTATTKRTFLLQYCSGT